MLCLARVCIIDVLVINSCLLTVDEIYVLSGWFCFSNFFQNSLPLYTITNSSCQTLNGTPNANVQSDRHIDVLSGCKVNHLSVKMDLKITTFLALPLTFIAFYVEYKKFLLFPLPQKNWMLRRFALRKYSKNFHSKRSGKILFRFTCRFPMDSFFGPATLILML